MGSKFLRLQDRIVCPTGISMRGIVQTNYSRSTDPEFAVFRLRRSYTGQEFQDVLAANRIYHGREYGRIRHHKIHNKDVRNYL